MTSGGVSGTSPRKRASLSNDTKNKFSNHQVWGGRGGAGCSRFPPLYACLVGMQVCEGEGVEDGGRDGEMDDGGRHRERERMSEREHLIIPLLCSCHHVKKHQEYLWPNINSAKYWNIFLQILFWSSAWPCWQGVRENVHLLFWRGKPCTCFVIHFVLMWNQRSVTNPL